MLDYVSSRNIVFLRHSTAGIRSLKAQQRTDYNWSKPVHTELRFSAEEQKPFKIEDIFLHGEQWVSNRFNEFILLWHRISDKVENLWFSFNRKLNPVSTSKLREIMPTLLQQSSNGFPISMLRADLIDKNSPDAFITNEELKKKYISANTSSSSLINSLVQSESAAYMMAHVTALETAIKTPDKKIAFENEDPSFKSIKLALEDANDSSTCQLSKSLYGKNKTPIADILYNLIFASPKITLHDHYRGCSPISMVRTRLIDKLNPKGFIDTEDLKNYCRTERLYSLDGKGPLYHRDLNRFREKYDTLLAQSIYSDKTAYLAAYLYALRLGVEKVRYFEYRLNPLSKDVKDPLRYIKAIQTGLDDAMEFMHQNRGWKMDGNIILSADRQPKLGVDLTPKPGEKYDPRVELALKILQIAIKARENGLRVSGFDIQGDEEGYAVTDFKPVADALKEYNRKMVDNGKPELRIGATIHAGETPRSGCVSQPDDILSGEESIAKAIELFWDEHTPLRIGHGTRIMYSPKLIDICRQKNIGLEQCPKSNVQTDAVSYYRNLPTLMLSRDYNLKVSIASDNRTLCKTDSNNEMVKLTRYWEARHEDRKKFQMDGLDIAFIFDTSKKEAIIKDMQDMYTDLEQDPEHQKTIELEKDRKKFKALLENRKI